MRASVVVFTYLGRDRVGDVLERLREQTVRDFETVLVCSGGDGCAERVRERFPEAVVVASRERLGVGAARNAGIAAARGEVIAFLPDDGLPDRDWLERRLELHDRGFPVVGGAVVNAHPGSWVARAEYLHEYSALVPVQAMLEAQATPHAISVHRAVFERLGSYPEDAYTGEDTLFARRIVEAGIPVAFSAEVRLAHRGSTTLPAMLRHAWRHGRGLAQVTWEHGMPSILGRPARLRDAARHALWELPRHGVRTKRERVRAHAPELAGELRRTLPLIVLALLATGAGALRSWWALRARLRVEFAS